MSVHRVFFRAGLSPAGLRPNVLITTRTRLRIYGSTDLPVADLPVADPPVADPPVATFDGTVLDVDARSNALPFWGIFFDYSMSCGVSRTISRSCRLLSVKLAGPSLPPPFSASYLSGAGAPSALSLINVLSLRVSAQVLVLGVDDTAQAWQRLRGSWADLPAVHPLPRDHIVKFPILEVTDARDGPDLLYPSPGQPASDGHVPCAEQCYVARPVGASARTPAGPGTGPVLGSTACATAHRRRAMSYRPRQPIPLSGLVSHVTRATYLGGTCDTRHVTRDTCLSPGQCSGSAVPLICLLISSFPCIKMFWPLHTSP
jgi:hypothetical protein